MWTEQVWKEKKIENLVQVAIGLFQKILDFFFFLHISFTNYLVFFYYTIQVYCIFNFPVSNLIIFISHFHLFLIFALFVALLYFNSYSVSSFNHVIYYPFHLWSISLIIILLCICFIINFIYYILHFFSFYIELHEYYNFFSYTYLFNHIYFCHLFSFLFSFVFYFLFQFYHFIQFVFSLNYIFIIWFLCITYLICFFIIFLFHLHLLIFYRHVTALY